MNLSLVRSLPKAPQNAFAGLELDSPPDLAGQVFAPTRLSLARERRGLTKKSLAQELEVSADAITKFEKARCNPTPENVVRCAQVLEFPLEWFYQSDLALLDPNAPSFRSRRSMTQELRVKATRAGDLAASVLSPFLHRKFVLPSTSVPDLSRHSPEEAALYLRAQLGLGMGPISNVVHVMEKLGVGVFWLNEQSNSLDAWSVWHDDMPFVLLNQRTDAGCRGRFDAAHELGHLVLHCDAKIIDGLAMEKEANQFAATFLMPPEQFLRECPRMPNLRAFFPLKKRWGVSLAAMVMQCQTQDYFSEWSARRAFQDIASNGWRLAEPKEIALPRESSAIHPLLWQQIQEDGLSAHALAQMLRINVVDLWELIPSTQQQLKPSIPYLRLV